MKTDSFCRRWAKTQRSAANSFLGLWRQGGCVVLASVAVSLPGLVASADTDYLDIHLPVVGDQALHILSPTLLELYLVNTKQPDPATVDSWDWVTNEADFAPPNLSSIQVNVDGQVDPVAQIGFKRRPLYAPLNYWDLRIGNYLYLKLSTPIVDNQIVQVINDGTLWPTTNAFTAVADPLRFNPAIHINQEGYMPEFPKKGIVGYFVGNLGEMTFPTNLFYVVDAQSGATIYSNTMTLRQDVGYNYTPTPYQNVEEADFSGVTTPGQYLLVVPGLGASLPFQINEGIAMDFARTYALGIYEQRSGCAVSMPFTRFTHAPDHLAPAMVPTNDSAPFEFTWLTVSNYAVDLNSDNPPQEAPLLTNYEDQLYPFVNPGPVEVSGGHFEAGDYNRVSYNSAQLIHTLVFAADSLPGISALDNLGIPESGDGISDVLEEAKWEADFLIKMQDTDGGFYYSVYPQFREYEDNVLPEDGDPQVVWPKNSACTAAAVAALAQISSSPRFKQAYPQAASNYLATALLGWKFLTNAIANYGYDGTYQEVQHFGDDFTDHDEMAWAACELYLATGDSQYETNLFTWFPDPTDPATFEWGWVRMFMCYGNAVRDYAFAVQSGRLSPAQIDTNYVAKCISTITNCANDDLGWSQDNAYGSSFPDLTKAYRGGGWYFSPEQAFDIVVGYQFNSNPAYLDAIIRNLNYEGGCNPVNMTYITGLGWKRQRNVVDQYSANDGRALPKDGVPISNIDAEFSYTWTYGVELNALTFPSDDADTAPYPYYDRWCDDWNVSTEASTTDTARNFAVSAWLATQTSVANQPWTSTSATIIAPSTAQSPGQAVTVSLKAADTNLSEARIIWEPLGQDVSFGSTNFTFTLPLTNGIQEVEAEIQWPDGRRAFATNSIIVSGGLPPQMSNLQMLAGGGFTFVLTGVPLATNVVQASTDLVTWQPFVTNVFTAAGTITISDPAADLSCRYYRAVLVP